MFRARMKKRFRHGDSEWQCPLKPPVVLLRQIQFNTQVNILLSNPYNKISAFKLLIWFILDLGYILNGGGQALSRALVGRGCIRGSSHAWHVWKVTELCLKLNPHSVVFCCLHFFPSPLRQDIAPYEKCLETKMGIIESRALGHLGVLVSLGRDHRPSHDL